MRKEQLYKQALNNLGCYIHEVQPMTLNGKHGFSVKHCHEEEDQLEDEFFPARNWAELYNRLKDHDNYRF